MRPIHDAPSSSASDEPSQKSVGTRSDASTCESNWRDTQSRYAPSGKSPRDPMSGPPCWTKIRNATK